MCVCVCTFIVLTYAEPYIPREIVLLYSSGIAVTFYVIACLYFFKKKRVG